MSTPPNELPPLRSRLRAALPAAMKSRDRAAAAALRSALAAIDNAEAVAPAETSPGAIEASPIGAGAAEAPRRDLTESDIEQIVRKELTERLTTAAEYDALGHTDRANQLRAEAAALSAHLTPE
ncbi:GatB/YqeY domain-containing protein [Nocardia sp. CDC159]|uniref:GatB/YqeY domain-containing protein n=1 Tax=Nocardia pulmonis TaxID=2951408 RepID=A0A9X2IWS5_9NOCA|nr:MULTISPECIES: GatB/YqeY domain-containing protein [Nocardia]MCM6773889.1 GatB/YqeY domain-containing protein [Nocardia pulmonis]MCM6786776.1 GatB/YqeY domain-containing protein [Nocardia sp. CDC159]